MANSAVSPTHRAAAQSQTLFCLNAVLDHAHEATPTEGANAISHGERLGADHCQFVVPVSHACPIDILPNELLLEIFIVGHMTDMMEGWDVGEEFDEGDKDDEDDEDDLLNIVSQTSDGGDPGEEHGHGQLAPRSYSNSTSGSSYEHAPLPEFCVIVSHVCGRWRTLALNSPALWNMVVFTENPPFIKSQTWIERSKDLPLSIYLDTEDDDDDTLPAKSRYDLPQIEQILSLLLPHVPRWKEVDITVAQYEHMDYILGALIRAPAAPLLEALKLNYHEELVDADTFMPQALRDSHSLPLFHSDAPRLRHVSLWRVHLPWDVSLQLLSCLTSLELALHANDVRPSWPTFISILMLSPALETLTLSMSGYRISSPGKDDPNEDPRACSIPLPTLTSLTLAYLEPRYICSLQALLRTPALTSLVLDLEGDDFTSFARQLTSPVRAGDAVADTEARSVLAGLSHLTISGFPCDVRYVDTIYQQLSNLKDLKLDCTYLENYWFSKLASPSCEDAAPILNSNPSSVLHDSLPIPTPPPSDPTANSSSRLSASVVYCPLLETLTTIGVSGNSMRDFVGRRREAGCPLKKVSMTHGDLLPNDCRWLRSNLERFMLLEPDEDDEYETESEEEQEVHA